jgi:hypothetical protein
VKIFRVFKLIIAVATLFTALPYAACQVTLGGAGGNVTLVNPDNSTIFYDSSNSTIFTHITNYPDGWWSIPDPGLVDEELWVLGVLFAFIALAVSIAFVYMKREN